MSEKHEYSLRRLSVLAYAQGFTQWVYQQAAPLDAICAPEFFSGAADMVMSGDHIHVSAADGAALLWVQSSDNKERVVTKALARA